MQTRPSGYCRCGRFDADDRFVPLTPWAENARSVTSRYILAQAFGRSDPDYGARYLYVEYSNVANPTPPVASAPADRLDLITYYDLLAGDPSRDFLRVPILVTPTLLVSTGSELYYGPGQGDVLLFSGRTAATAGVHGKPFAAGVNSKVLGVALVAAPLGDDRTGDLLFARAYFPDADQFVAPANSQLGVEYKVPF